MAEDAFVDDVGEERGLRDEFIEEVRDVLLAIRHEGFVVARAAAEGDYHGLAILRDRHAAQGGGAEEGCGSQRRSRCEGSCGGWGNRVRDLVRTAGLQVGEAHRPNS
jgi:hypothetical protein